MKINWGDEVIPAGEQKKGNLKMEPPIPLEVCLKYLR